MIAVFTIILFIISYEAIMWGWTLNQHSIWLKKNIKDRRNTLVSYNVLKYTACVTSILSSFMWLLWLLIISVSEIVVLYGILIVIIQLLNIHFSVLLARYACLPRSFWSIISKYISIFLVYSLHIKEPILTSKDLTVCWGLDYDKRGENYAKI